MLWRGGVSGAMLEELRAIRSEIQSLRETVANAPTREELNAYLPRETFDTYVKERERTSWRQTVPIWLAGVAVLWTVVGPYVHFGMR